MGDGLEGIRYAHYQFAPGKIFWSVVLTEGADWVLLFREIRLLGDETSSFCCSLMTDIWLLGLLGGEDKGVVMGEGSLDIEVGGDRESDMDWLWAGWWFCSRGGTSSFKICIISSANFLASRCSLGELCWCIMSFLCAR